MLLISDYAPSFEESDLALSKLIETSDLRESITSADDSEQCQLQPLNQLLLNFIWVTLKVCSYLQPQTTILIFFLNFINTTILGMQRIR